MLQPHADGHAGAEQGRDGDSGPTAPGIAMGRTASRSSQREVEPTPNISRMTPISASCVAICGSRDETRRERADHDAGQQVADDGRQPQPRGEETADEGDHQRHAMVAMSPVSCGMDPSPYSVSFP